MLKKRLKLNLFPHFLFHFVLVIQESLNLAILFAMVTFNCMVRSNSFA